MSVYYPLHLLYLLIFLVTVIFQPAVHTTLSAVQGKRSVFKYSPPSFLHFSLYSNQVFLERLGWAGNCCCGKIDTVYVKLGSTT